MSFDSLLPLIKKSGSTLDPETFHRTVNVVFHDIEAGHYDALHAQMWESLGKQVELLVGDFLTNHSGTVGQNLRLLDIGCGTGLSSQLLLQSKLGNSIGHVTLADTSAKMLEQATQKAQSWGKPFKSFLGDVAQLDEKFDVVMISSVLHHIPDIAGFMKEVDRLLNPGGILIHMQDPNGDYLEDAALIERVEKYRSVIQASPEKKWMKKLKTFVKKIIGRTSYIDQVNQRLLDQKAITRRMTAEEIWSVTDIHVSELPYSIGKGISLSHLKSILNDFTLTSFRSYGFFGYLKSELMANYQPQEERLIDEAKPNGSYFGAVWVKSQR